MVTFDPLLGGFTTLDISSPEYLVGLVKWTGRLLETEDFEFLDENGRPSRSFGAVQGDFPEQYLKRWQQEGGAGFQPVGIGTVKGTANWRFFNGRAGGRVNNSFYVSAPLSFWEKDLERTACFLAEIVHEMDCIVGDLRLARVKLWPGSPLLGLVHVPHLVCFGSPYIDLFGLEKLLSAPVYKAKRYHGNAVVLQLFEALISVDSAEWGLMQERLRRHLGLRYFRDPNEKPDRSMFFSLLDFPKGVEFALEMLRISQRRRHGKSAAGESVVAPKINWERMRRHS